MYGCVIAASVQAGIGLGVFTLVAITGVCLVTATYLLDTMCRAEALERAKIVDGIDENSPAEGVAAGSEVEVTGVRSAHAITADADASVPLVRAHKDTAAQLAGRPRLLSEPVFMRISNRKFEVVELMKIFYGERGRRAYLIAICLYMYGSIWSYGTVFGNAMSSHVPLPMYVVVVWWWWLALCMSLCESNRQGVARARFCFSHWFPAVPECARANAGSTTEKLAMPTQQQIVLTCACKRTAGGGGAPLMPPAS